MSTAFEGPHSGWEKYLEQLLRHAARTAAGYFSTTRVWQMVHTEMYRTTRERTGKQVTTGVLLAESLRNMVRLSEPSRIYPHIHVVYALIDALYRRRPHGATTSQLFWKLHENTAFADLAEARVEEVLELLETDGWLVRQDKLWHLIDAGYVEGKPNMMSRRERLSTFGVGVMAGLSDYLAGAEGSGFHVVTAVGTRKELEELMERIHSAIVEYHTQTRLNAREESIHEERFSIYIVTRKQHEE